ncbi:MAG: VIT and VWA domain-containing protein [Pirellulales bacterium]
MAVRMKQVGFLITLLAFGAFTALHANAAGLLIADGGLGGVLEIKEQNVHVTINNGIAVTEVDQVFLNTENRIVEALYTFPVPKGASVSNFSMWIGGQEMIGEVVEKQRARQIYDSYKQQKRDPGLLEQVDYKRFEMRIFPIPAGAEQRVKLTYYQELDTDHDWTTYVYPLATVARPGLDQKTKGHFAVTVDVKSEVPITAIESPSHKDRIVVAKHSENYWRASLETPAGSLEQDVVVACHCERPTTGVNVISSKTEGQPGVLQLSLTVGKELEEVNKGMDYVFVLDVSGSMAFDGKLPLSRTSLRSFIDSLGPEDKFEVITFNITPNTLFNETRAANEDNLKQAITFLESQKALGGTVLRPAIDTAYRYQNPDRTLNVVVLSDGMTEQKDQAELVQLIQKRPPGSRVFCVGVGNEVNRPLLTQLAEQAGGLAAFISQGDDFSRQAQAFRRKLMRPAISNLKIAFEGGEVYDVEPQKLPNLYHGSPLRVYGRYDKAGSTNVTITGDVQGQPFSQSLKLELPARDDTNPEIERMWAWKRVDQLLASARERGNVDSVRTEVVKLCEEFSITSEYASFIVLENDGEYQRWKIERRNVGRLGRDRAAQARVQQQLETLREQAISKLGPPVETAQKAISQATPAPAPGPVDQTVNTQPVPTTMPNLPQPTTSRSRPDFDLRLPGGGGGGAIDPISAAIGLGLAGASAIAAKRRGQLNQQSNNEI